MSDDQLHKNELPAVPISVKAVEITKAFIRGTIGTLPVGAIPVELADARDAIAAERWKLFVDQLMKDLEVRIEQLEESITQNAATTELFLDGVDAAGHARSSKNIRVMARVVADALQGTDTAVRFDVAHAVLRALDGLEASHIELLTLMDLIVSQADGSVDITEGAFRRDFLQQQSGLDEIPFAVLYSDLVAKGLVRAEGVPSVYGPRKLIHEVALTGMAQAVIRYLADIAQTE
jgi:hypothetical protein